MYGRGIYMSENPIYCKLYGNCLILCKVLRCSKENCESVKIVKKGWYNIYVLPNTRQILPFCIIELKSDFEKTRSFWIKTCYIKVFNINSKHIETLCSMLLYACTKYLTLLCELVSWKKIAFSQCAMI